MYFLSFVSSNRLFLALCFFIFPGNSPALAAPPQTERQKALQEIRNNADSAHDELDGKPAKTLKEAPVENEDTKDAPSTSESSESDESSGTESETDVYSTISYNKLLLNRRFDSTLPVHLNAVIAREFKKSRFDNETWSVGDPQTANWCREATKEMQIVRGNVDAETGDADLTLDAVTERCSPIYEYRVGIHHGCETVQDKKKYYIKCSIKTKVALDRYVVTFNDSQDLGFKKDESFAEAGTKTMIFHKVKSRQLTKKRNATQAKREAMGSAVGSTRVALELALKNIRDFQLHAPIVARKTRTTYMCLGREVPLDTPFHVMINTASGEKKMGFVKARKIYDGCVLTPKLEAQEEAGKEIVLKPLSADIILGGGRIRQGMTAWEMPSIGLNAGFSGGVAPIIGDAQSPSFGFALEANLADGTGISELFVFIRARLVFVSDAQPLEDSFREGFPGISDWFVDFPESTVGAQGEIGLLKRWYLAGPIFAELGAGFAASRYFIDSFHVWFIGDEVDMQVDGFGLAGTGGLGMQLAPRWLLRFHAGYRALLTYPTIEINDEPCSDVVGSICNSEGGLGTEAGMMTSLDLLYTY